ncbi:DUF4372 domain-containing protein [Bacteroides uniformis]|uniref:DUF4372 domain-containing protein n=1 Tax=Bacteroides uniformis TaxID=820 RepID=A0A374MQ69_BACUN|nr:DUF4372 domain-containing protein [Bacteroides uniformis]RJV05602.1 DUF4372 domain-containing protein [Bacteroides sp. AF34-31BH]RGL15985.1 DUF4372 domain-containing protein [Bacteroides uniformis]RGV43999.1 DUF4372 domain-containing protein [Bacteroides uniformis]RGV92445.1 DUF4372 domain-containing protein [Bacteroides uniformis]
MCKSLYSLSPTFGQLSNRKSLRNLIIVSGRHQDRACHLGLDKQTTDSN